MAQKRYPKSFVNKLSDADGEAAETIVWLDFALRFGHLSADEHRELIETYDHICSQLTIMMAEPEKWTPRK
jgi:four helix bundle protein